MHKQDRGTLPTGVAAGASICGVCHRGETGRDAVEAMLAALPGQGRAERIDCGAASFGSRSLRAGAREGRGSGPSVRGLAIAADARLDNRAELADALGLAGPGRTGLGDSELILRAYERWGEDCPQRLHGDYAFAVWDPGKRLLFCSRDATGVRPFHYASGPGGRFVFASHAAAALAAPGVGEELDEAHVAAYLMGQIPAVGTTFFRSVRSLPPGHSITVDAETERIRRWWRPEDAPPVRRAADADYESELLDHLARAVRDRLRGAEPLGVHLSGGLDSSSIACLAARELRRAGAPPPHALCWHPPPGGAEVGDEAAEYRLIESVCAQEGLEPLYHAMSAERVLAMLRRDGARFPNHDGTLMHEAMVQRSAAALGVRVVLSGWGGDEAASYSGAGYYAELLRGGRLGQLLREARGLSDRPWRFAAGHALLPLLGVRAESVKALLRGEAPRKRREGFASPASIRELTGRSMPGRRLAVRPAQLALLGNGHLAQRIEDWAASGAAAGIEYRYPLLDRRLVEFVLGLPAEQFRRGPGGRRLFRRALRPVLPPLVRNHADKRDPARYRAFKAALDAALPTVNRQLAARREPPARARYLDMQKLREHLNARQNGEGSPTGKLARALRFLDWHAG